MKPFKVVSPFEPAGDQPQAIANLAAGVRAGMKDQTLLGVTGSGKTFTMAKLIEAVPKANTCACAKARPLLHSWQASFAMSCRKRRLVLCVLLRLLPARSRTCRLLTPT